MSARHSNIWKQKHLYHHHCKNDPSLCTACCILRVIHISKWFARKRYILLYRYAGTVHTAYRSMMAMLTATFSYVKQPEQNLMAHFRSINQFLYYVMYGYHKRTSFETISQLKTASVSCHGRASYTSATTLSHTGMYCCIAQLLLYSSHLLS